MRLKNINFSYGEKTVLKNLNLDVAEGERMALYGASGKGKTTLLHILLGFLKPDSGEMEGVPEGVSVVFQEDRLLEHLSAGDNIALVSDKSREEIRGLLFEVGLAGEENTKIKDLSGGMKRRVAIARAMAFPKPLYLMDEPFKGLDENTRRTVAEFVLKYVGDSTLIVISHDPEEAELLGARVVKMEEINGKS